VPACIKKSNQYHVAKLFRGTVFYIKNISHVFQMLNIFGSLLERPIIKADFDFKYPILLEKFNSSLDASKKLFDEHLAESENLVCFITSFSL